jgi:hypothetical protein
MQQYCFKSVLRNLKQLKHRIFSRKWNVPLQYADRHQCTDQRWKIWESYQKLVGITSCFFELHRCQRDELQKCANYSNLEWQPLMSKTPNVNERKFMILRTNRKNTLPRNWERQTSPLQRCKTVNNARTVAIYIYHRSKSLKMCNKITNPVKEIPYDRLM